MKNLISNGRSLLPPAFYFGSDKKSKSSKLSEFIKKARQVHGNKYDYSLVEYTNARTKIKIKCNQCSNIFEQFPDNHIRKKHGCPYCAGNKKLTTDEFINQAKQIHGDKYDYSLVNYRNADTKVKIICKRCNLIFEKTPNKHINSMQGCPVCSKERRASKLRLTTEEFIKKARQIHKDKYDYSLAIYKNNKTKVKIVCNKHNVVFEQSPVSHLKGIEGCKFCLNENKKSKKMSVSAINDRLQEYNSNYRFIERLTNRKYGIFLCKIHNLEFIANIDNVLNKKVKSCLKCANQSSKPEQEIFDYIQSLGVNSIHRDREQIKPKELDIYIPDKKIAIEFNGLYWHSFDFEDYVNGTIDKKKHLLKTELCEEKGIRLFHIFENEWLDGRKQKIWKSIIKNALGKVENKVYARECSIVELTDKEYREFLELNHLQGYAPAKVKLGLLFENELVAVMSFGKNRFKKNDTSVELIRYAVKTNYSVVGGFSKLLNYFIKKNKVSEIISYADRRYTYSKNNVYLKNGFEFVKKTEPNYYYIDKDKLVLYNRIKFQKHKLKSILDEFDDSKTEMWNVLNNGYGVIYDCGNLVYRLELLDRQ